MKNSDARLLHPVVQQQLRNKAVELFLKSKNLTDISRQLGVSRQAVYNWIEKYSKSGEKGLETHKRGRPKGSQMEP